MSNKGFIKFMRGDALEVIKASRNAWALASIIAYRARYSTAFNAEGLQPGEALLGDFHNYGMSKQEYRTAKKFLEKHGFATFRPTPHGTIGRLADTRLFDPLNSEPTPNATHGQHPANTRVTPNKKEGTKAKEGGEGPPPPFAAPSGLEHLADWQLRKDAQSIEDRIKAERDAAKPDRDLIRALKAQRDAIHAEIKRRCPSAADSNESERKRQEQRDCKVLADIGRRLTEAEHTKAFEELRKVIG